MISDGDQPSFFANAQSPTINGGVIAAVQGNAYFGSPTLSLSERRGMKILLDHIASGAFHDAAERGDPPKCHKDTRKSIIDQVMKWRLKKRPSWDELVMWLSGPAGAGKSAIMQTIAEMCALEDVLAGSFFFARTAPERNNPSRFIATLAYQLVQAFPDIQERIVAAIEADQAIFTRKLATQVQVLIVRPLNEMSKTSSGPLLPVEDENGATAGPAPKIVLIDALDECLTGTAQLEVLDAITSIISGVNLPTPPLIFLISSRPEYEIRQAFESGSANYFLACSMNIKLQPDYNADMDIEMFLQSTFQKIKDTHPIRSHLPPDWPTAQQIQYLVHTTSSQFIYAATVAKYIDSPRHNPSVRLNIILAPGNMKGKDTPFFELDNLYRLVLGAVADLPMVLDILTFLILRISEQTPPTIDFVSSLFGFDQSDVRLALTDMYALMNVPATNDDKADLLRIHHASMVDFLTDASRSGQFYIDSEKGHDHLAASFVRSITHFHEQPAASHSPFMASGMVAGFIAHCPRLHSTNEVKHALDTFSIEECLLRMPPDQFYDTAWKEFFACLKEEIFSKKIHDRILTQFDAWVSDRLSQYPDIIQTCIPAAYGIFPQFFLNSTESIFSIIMARRSDTQAVKLLDQTLFEFQRRDTFEPLAEFFSNRNRAGAYFPTEANFKSLAKEIVKNICPKERDPKKTLRVHLYANGWSPPYNLPYEGEDDGVISLHDRFCEFSFFEDVLNRCPNDLELAMFLRHQVLQLPLHASLDRIYSGRENIGKMGLQYIKDCGVSYRDHTHIPNLGQCLICHDNESKAPPIKKLMRGWKCVKLTLRKYLLKR